MSALFLESHRLSGTALAVSCTALILAGCAGVTSPPKALSSPPSTLVQSPMVATSTLASNRIVTSTPLPTFTPFPPPEPDVLIVDAAQSLGEISPLVYGSNVGPWQSITTADIELIKEAHLTIFRYPGGSYVDENSFSQTALDEFIQLCRETGAEPMVQVKLVNATPESAAKVVQYANITKGYGIKYWSIGNEPSLYFSQRNIAHYDSAVFNTQWRELALAMKAVDPTLLLLGPETHQYTGINGDEELDIHSRDWIKEFLTANGDLVDIVSFHRYPFGNFDPFPDELMKSSQEWDYIIPNLRQLILSTTGRDITIAVTEVNSNWSNRSREETTPDSFLNAIWWADSLGRMIGQHVTIVNQFALDGSGGWALLGSQKPRPSYYVYQIYNEFGNQVLFSSSGIENVSAYAARKADGSLSVILINRSNDPQQVKMILRNFAPQGSASWRLLDSAHMAAEMPSMQISNPSHLSLPALSVSLFLIPATN